MRRQLDVHREVIARMSANQIALSINGQPHRWYDDDDVDHGPLTDEQGEVIKQASEFGRAKGWDS